VRDLVESPASAARRSRTAISTVSVRSVLAGLVAILISACAAGPHYVAPELPKIDRFLHQPSASTAVEPQPDIEFWRSFGDPLLVRLVDAALRNNSDLRIAYANYRQAGALLRGSRAERLPVLNAAAEARSIRAAGAPIAGASGADRDREEYELGLGAFWELDFFGRVQRSIEAQRADTEAAEADFAAAQVAVAGELARSFLQLRGLQDQLRAARRNAETQQRTQQLLQMRLDAGAGTRFDVDRGRVILERTRARIPALEADIAATANRVAVLAGVAPQVVAAELLATSEWPSTPFSDSHAGTPGELLRRRPDVLAAERRLAAATARIGVATADLFPRFTLSGLVGTQALRPADLFRRDSETRLLALGMDGSFLNVARVRSQIAAANQVAAGELARYDRAVLTALEDTENALVRVARLERELEHLRQAAEAAVRAERVARSRLELGAIDVLELLDTERTSIEVEDAHLQGRRRHAQARVALYQALAGGWPTVPASQAQSAGSL